MARGFHGNNFRVESQLVALTYRGLVWQPGRETPLHWHLPNLTLRCLGEFQNGTAVDTDEKPQDSVPHGKTSLPFFPTQNSIIPVSRLQSLYWHFPACPGNQLYRGAGISEGRDLQQQDLEQMGANLFGVGKAVGVGAAIPEEKGAVNAYCDLKAPE